MLHQYMFVPYRTEWEDELVIKLLLEWLGNVGVSFTAFITSATKFGITVSLAFQCKVAHL